MKIADLGTLAGPVVAYGGALGDLAGLAALLSAATRLGVPAPRVICTGDILGPGPRNSDCVTATRAFGGPVVAGDVERALAAGMSGVAEAFPPGGGDSDRAAPWWKAARVLDGAARVWVERLPDIALFAHEGRRCAVLHGGATDPAHPLWPSAPNEAFTREITAIEVAAGPVDLVIVGHAGLAFERVVGGVHWINTGMIGLPAHDGRQGGRFLRLDAGGARIERLAYDPAPVFAEMVAAGLEQGFDLCLMSGWWPSEALLPAEMRR